MDKKMEDKKTNKKLKKALMKKKTTKPKKNLKQKIKQKVKQTVKQSTNINIKIGDIAKKKKRKKRKTGGEPMRLQRRPHLPTNPLVGAIQYTPTPGYTAPSDLARALPRPPPALPPPLPVAAAPVEGPAGELGAAVGAEGMPLRPYAAEGIAPLLPARRREEIVPRYNEYEQPSPRSSSAYATSYGTSGGALSPRTAIGRTAARTAAEATYNPQPSEQTIARLSASGFDPAGAAPILRRAGSATVAEGGGGSSRSSEQEDEGKSAGGGAGAASAQRPTLSVGWTGGIMESVNPVVFRQGQPMNGIRTGLDPINSGGASGGLIGGGSTMMGNQGVALEAQVSYPGQKVYKDTYANRRAGIVGQPKKRSGEGGAGGRRAGAGRKAKATDEPSSPTPSSSSTSSFSRLKRALTRKPKSPRKIGGNAQKKGVTLSLLPSNEGM